jgi:phage major head subunit gpT-like protein
MAAGLTYRLRPRGEPAPAAREFVTMTIVDMARTYLSAAGVSVRGSRDQVLARAFATGFHTTSDFPNLLTATGNRLLLDAYEAAPSALKRISRERTAADFRTLTMLRLGEAPALTEIVEGGEVTAGTIAEAKEAFRLKTYGKRFGLSRNALINDDLGAFGDMMAMWGTAAANLEADVLASLLTANSGDGANLDDGNPLYRTARGNKASSGTVIDVTNLDLARVAMRTVKGLDGVTPINATPRYLVVGPARETQGGQLLSQIMPATAANVNPFAGQLDLLVEPRLAGNAWRLFADPNTLPVLNHAYLNDARGPQVEMQQGWERLAVEVRCILDFGAGLSDWRGTYLNAGA